MAKCRSCLADKLLVSTVGMTRDEWLQQRRKSIGGSDAAGIIGLSKWSSPYSIWADKTCRLPDKPDSEAMRQGRDLEDYVARRWMEETGKKVRRLNSMIYNPAYPHSHADVDRWVVGENAGLECKTTSSMDLRKFDGVEFPEQYYCQCVHYMAVTGAERWHLAALVFGRGFYTFTLDRADVEKEIACLMAAEYAFWEQHVKPDVPPGMDGSDATTEALETIYRESSGETVELFGREALLDEYEQLKKSIDDLEERVQEITNIIKGDMRESEKAIAGAYTVSWKPQNRAVFDRRRFEADHKDTDISEYFKISTARPFKIKKEEQK